MKSLRKYTALILIIILAVIMTSCAKKENENTVIQKEEYIKITDLKGRKVVLDKKPERIVSLSPTNTEIVFALGAGDRLVGITNYCDYPEETKDIEKIGDFENPNIELIKKINPDLVLAGGYLQEEIIKTLEGLGIAVASTEAADVESIFDSLAMIGKLLKEEEKAEELINNIHKAIDDVKAKVANKNKPKVFYLVWKEPIFTTGRGTYINEIIQIAGGYNVASEMEGWAQYSFEELLKQNPDILVAAYHSTDEGMNKEDIMKDEFFSKLECVQKGNIHVMSDDNIVSRPGPRVIEAIYEMAEALHGDLE
ncbi:MAG TPA: cobalamin-binding protein [Clostridiales bacterium]|nr:cobalamin-binding protein [Clostridiales bacterium]